MKTRTFIAAAVLILIGAGALRMSWLRADPPVSSVGIVWDDEGAWTHNARNRVLFGQWRTDAWNPVYVAPVFIAAEYAAFETFGVGLWQARTVSVLAGLLAIGFLMAGLAATGGRRSALLGGALLATNYVFVMWNRAALMESTMTGFIVVSWAACALSERRPLWGWVSGAAAILAFFTKASSAAFLAALAVTVLWSLLNRPSRRAAWWTIAGVAAAGTLVVAVFVLPHWHDYVFYNFTTSVERKPSYALSDFARRISLLPFAQNFYTQMWPVTVVGALGLIGIAARWRTARPSHRLLVLWVLMGMLELIVHDSTNSRYHVMLIPALIALAAVWWNRPAGFAGAGADADVEADAGADATGWRRARTVATVLTVAVGFVVWGALLRGPLAARADAGDYKLLVRSSAALAMASGAAVWLLWRRLAAWQPRDGVMRTVAGAFVAMAGWNLIAYTQWAVARTDLNYRASVALGQRLPPGTLVQGKLANGLALDNRIHPVFIGNGFGNYADRFDRDDVRYILTLELPYEGFESGQKELRLIPSILDRYPSVGPAGQRHPIAEWDVQATPGRDVAALFDKFPDR